MPNARRMALSQPEMGRSGRAARRAFSKAASICSRRSSEALMDRGSNRLHAVVRMQPITHFFALPGRVSAPAQSQSKGVITPSPRSADRSRPAGPRGYGRLFMSRFSFPMKQPRDPPNPAPPTVVSISRGIPQEQKEALRVHQRGRVGILRAESGPQHRWHWDRSQQRWSCHQRLERQRTASDHSQSPWGCS
jgi:hypothetical protein